MLQGGSELFFEYACSYVLAFCSCCGGFTFSCRSYAAWTPASTVYWRALQEVERAWPCCAQPWAGNTLSSVRSLWPQQMKHTFHYLFRLSHVFRSLELLHFFLMYVHFDTTAKVAEQGSCVEGKSQLDKNCGDHKKQDEEKNNCRCVCHSKTNATTATSAAGPAVIDLTQSPCKGKSEPATSAAQHGKQFSMSGAFIVLMTLIEPIVHICSAWLCPLFIYNDYVFDQKQHKQNWLFSQLRRPELAA